MKVIIIGILSGIINGLFGSGAGMILLPVLATDIGEIKARGTTIMSVLFLSIISSFFYIKNLNSDMELITIWYVIAGGIIGGAIGAKVIQKIPIKYLQIILGVFMVFTGIRMIGR